MPTSYRNGPHSLLRSPHWTLFLELKFYILFAAVVWFGVTYRRVVLFNVAWTVLYLFAFLSKFQPLIVLVEPRWAPYFIAGTTLYLIRRFGPTLLLWSMLGVSMAMTAPLLQDRIAPMAEIYPISYPVALAVMYALYGLMILLALGKLDWLRWPGLMTVGALTYPLYLLHRQLGWVAIDRLHDSMPAWLLLTLVVTGALTLAWIVHRLVERPLAPKLRRGLKRSFTQVRDAETADGTPEIAAFPRPAVAHTAREQHLPIGSLPPELPQVHSR
jgi:peptidoglycan/LPS O-acetylase OafA/YrhL